MAIINIPRGPWNIDNTLITATTRLANGNVQVVVAGLAYELTVAEAVLLLNVTIPQLPPTIPGAGAGSVVPNSSTLVLGLNNLTGKLVILAFGQAINSAGIIAQVGAAALHSDGSVYMSIVSGAGTFWVKKNDVWTNAV